MTPETKKATRFKHSKQYSVKPIWWIRCEPEQKWLPERACCGDWNGVKCCTHNAGSEMVDGKLVVECNA